MIKVCIPTVPERKEKLRKCLDAIKKNTEEDLSWFIYTNNAGGWVKACHEMLEKLSDEKMVIILGDDALVQKGWMTALLAAVEKHGEDKFYCVNDGKFKQSIAVFPCARVSYLRRYLYRGYGHYAADTELTAIAKAQGNFVYVPDSVILHEHPIYGSDGLQVPEMDDVYKTSWNKWKKVDESLFKQRRLSSDGFKDLSKIDMNEVEQ